MDKQKSYGENYQPTTIKHKFSVKFFLTTFFACVVTVVVCIICLGVLL